MSLFANKSSVRAAPAFKPYKYIFHLHLNTKRERAENKISPQLFALHNQGKI